LVRKVPPDATVKVKVLPVAPVPVPATPLGDQVALGAPASLSTLVAPMVEVRAVTGYGVPGAPAERLATLSVRSVQRLPVGAAGMLIEKVLWRLPVLSILTAPLIGRTLLTGSAPVTVMNAEHQPGPTPTGAVPRVDAQL